jgi:hypothetical protein
LSDLHKAKEAGKKLSLIFKKVAGRYLASCKLRCRSHHIFNAIADAAITD